MILLKNFYKGEKRLVNCASAKRITFGLYRELSQQRERRTRFLQHAKDLKKTLTKLSEEPANTLKDA